MSEASNYLENALINHILRNITYTSPTTVYVGLFTSPVSEAATTADLEAGTLTNEVTGGAYARQSVTFGAPSNGVSSNSVQVTFPTATASWGVVTHFAILDAVTSGNVLAHSPLDDPKTIDPDDEPKFSVGELVVTIA